jgi:PAS domain-containing protein
VSERERPGIQIDTSRFPVVVHRWLTADLDEEDVRLIHEALDGILARGEPFATIVDGSRLDRLPPAPISRALERWVEVNEEAVTRLSLGTATIARTVIARGVARWVLHQRRVKTQGTVVRSYEEAITWCVARLKTRGVSVDDRLLVGLADNEPVPEAIRLVTGELDEERRALVELVMSSFSEPAFLIDVAGACLFMNAAAVAAFGEVPVWLRQTLAAGHDELKALVRLAPLELGADALLVIPSEELVPRSAGEGPALDLPDSLRTVATLLAQGLSDKEIAAYSSLSVSTVRTYVARIFKRTHVHSRGEFIRRYARVLEQPAG